MTSSECTTCNCFRPTIQLAQEHWSALGSFLRVNEHSSEYVDRETLSQVEHDIAGYEEEIRRLESRIASLKIRREELRKYVSWHDSLSAPIRRLPNELLLEIFFLVWAENHALAPTLMLAAVCMHWRSLAVQTPRLWTSLHDATSACDYLGSDLRRKQIMSVIEVALERSKNHQLSFTVRDRDNAANLRALTHESPRWFNVSLHGSALIMLGHDICLPKLKYVELVSTDFSQSTTLPAMPSLRSLKVHSSSRTGLMKAAFPWAQLTELVLSSVHFDACAVIVPRCTQLVSLKLQSCVMPEERVPFASSLSILNLRGMSLYSVAEFFESATLMQLTSAQIEHRNAVYDVHSLTAFLSRVQCSITVLSINKIEYSDTATLITFLGALPAVTKLTLHEDSMTTILGKDVLQRLHPLHCPPREVLLPCLTHFDVQNTYLTPMFQTFAELDWDVLGEVVQSRRNPPLLTGIPVARLESLVLSLPCFSPTFESLSPILDLRRSGMTVIIIGKDGVIG